jgi:uncharacterized protein
MGMIYPCTACGACCRNISALASLDRGDGVCQHYDEVTRLCTVYDERPLVCRIDRYYETRLRHKMPATTFYTIQAYTCVSLSRDNADLPHTVLGEMRAQGVADNGMPPCEQDVLDALKIAKESFRPADAILMHEPRSESPAAP